MTWYAIEVRSDVARHEAIAAWLVGRTGHAVEERADGTIVSFALNLRSAEALARDLSAAHGPGIETTHTLLPEVDWGTAWRAGLGVRHVGNVSIVPSWIDHVPGPEEAIVTLDPEMAFGSGEHGSTRAALLLLQRHLRPGRLMLDLGSGSGILSIAGARLGASRAIGVEVDEESLPVAERNAERNGVADKVTFLQGDAAVIAPLLGPAQIVVSNILRLVNIALLPEIHAALSPDGVAIFSGMEQAEAPLFRAPLEEHGFRIVDEQLDEGWWAVAAVRA